MTTEQKAKAYDEAIKKIRKGIQPLQDGSKISGVTNGFLEEVFPELKESEDVDKKIREEIIATIHLYYGKPLEDEAKEMIAWLEKQEGCEYIKKDWLEHIKQSWYKEGFIDGKYSGGTSKEWTINDAAIFKEIIDFLENGTAKLQHDLTKYANWLKIQYTPIEKQGRQFSVDKLKPKFHEGEWITNGDYTWKIVDVKPLDYILQPQDGIIVDDTISHVDEQFHSFTIEDAKDGDVLACNNGWTCIFKTLVNDETFSSYCFMDKTKWFCETGSECHTLKEEFVKAYNGKIHPATKEQRDTLFAKMKETGYEWDAEKRELKKIEQKQEENKRNLGGISSNWSEEDENEVAILEAYIRSKDWSESHIGRALGIVNELVNKCKSSKDRVQPKQEWSEEDEKNLQGIIDEIQANKSSAPSYDINVYDRFLNWLKSPKERYAWKPSSVQVECLYDAINHYHTNGYPASKLNELYEQLSKIYKL